MWKVGILRVLVVDDSIVFRSQIKSALESHSDIEVVGTAANGKIALDKLSQLSVDLVTLDLEMPELNGIETLKEMRKRGFDTKVIVFSSKSKQGSEATLEALTSGAQDFLAKPSGENLSIETAGDAIRKQLLPKVIQFIASRPEMVDPLSEKVKTDSVVVNQASAQSQYLRKTIDTFNPSLIVIGSSTGGPAALEKIFTGLKGTLKIPIVICQHMPPIFTASLAKRLHQITEIEAKEASNLETIENKIYIAPGDFHLTIGGDEKNRFFKTDQRPLRNSVRPAVDHLFETASEAYQSKCMGIVLTGMGDDGAIGCDVIKKNAGGVMIQNKASCVVFGMPGAVFQLGAYDQQGDLEQIKSQIKRMAFK
ncbi:MAG: chemotaxis response regulator protein-glutamate methylesterase [Phyllobacteriaceae bacterium]|nr:chemotaxis response regulator protein-glutamate methylesterase [Phyllobacteriaceae bacterium]